MPFGDGTGPLGQGPMTGWGRGPCGRGLARGWRGSWRGRGFGSGWRWPWLSGRTKEDEKAALDEEEKILEEELAQVRAAKKDLENKN